MGQKPLRRDTDQVKPQVRDADPVRRDHDRAVTRLASGSLLGWPTGPGVVRGAPRMPWRKKRGRPCSTIGEAGSDTSEGWLECGGDRKNMERTVKGARKPFC